MSSDREFCIVGGARERSQSASLPFGVEKKLASGMRAHNRDTRTPVSLASLLFAERVALNQLSDFG